MSKNSKNYFKLGFNSKDYTAGEQTAAVKQENHFYRQTFVLLTLQTFLNSYIFPPNKTKERYHVKFEQNHDNICRFHRAQIRILTRVKIDEGHAQLENISEILALLKIIDRSHVNELTHLISSKHVHDTSASQSIFFAINALIVLKFSPYLARSSPIIFHTKMLPIGSKYLHKADICSPKQNSTPGRWPFHLEATCILLPSCFAVKRYYAKGLLKAAIDNRGVKK